MNTIKTPYEISLWEDRLTFVDINGYEYENIAPNDKKTPVSYFKEIKLCTIGSHKINSPIMAYSPQLKRNVNGTNVLTFSIYSKYYDEEGLLKDNPFIPLLTNERKVKLKIIKKDEIQWLDFVIKNTAENSENYSFTYTATDLFINELSKNGYNLQFAEELENNLGTVNQLGKKILEGTDWQIGTETETIQQFQEEALYKIILKQDIEAFNILTDEKMIIPAEEVIYSFYSCVSDPNNSYFQFLYNENGEYLVDDKRVIYNAQNYYLNFSNDEKNTGTYPPFAKTVEYINEYRGERLVRSQLTAYDPVLDKYVKIYTDNMDKEVYGYSEVEYITENIIQSYITNGTKYVSTSGWDQNENQLLKLITVPSFMEKPFFDGERVSTIKFTQTESNFLFNTGFRDNLNIIKEVNKNAKFMFRIKCNLLEEEKLISPEKTRFKIQLKTFKFLPDGTFEKDSNSTKILLEGQTDLIRDPQGYFITRTPLIANFSLSNQQLIDDNYGFFITAINEENLQNVEYYLEDVQFFDYILDSSSRLCLPGGFSINLNDENETVESNVNSYISTKNYFYYPNQATTKEEIEYLYIGENTDNFKPKYNAKFEKIRSITSSESNRFNLLQLLSETFDCWCRFDIKHKDTGEIMLLKDCNNLVIDAGTSTTVMKDATMIRAGNSKIVENVLIKSTMIPPRIIDQSLYQQQKFVTFHKNIGQVNNIDFKYGINLKSINRTQESEDIVSKLIVKNNNNEHALYGSCSIARAKENLIKDNFILDFTYYVNQGLLDYNTFYNDLYYLKPDIVYTDNFPIKWNSIALYETKNATYDHDYINYIKISNLQPTHNEMINLLKAKTMSATYGEEIQEYHSYNEISDGSRLYRYGNNFLRLLVHPGNEKVEAGLYVLNYGLLGKHQSIEDGFFQGWEIDGDLDIFITLSENDMKDISIDIPNNPDNHYLSYYPSLRKLNSNIENLGIEFNSLSENLIKYEADFQTISAQLEANIQALNEKKEYFYELTHFEYDNIDKNKDDAWLKEKEVISLCEVIDRLKIENKNLETRKIQLETNLGLEKEKVEEKNEELQKILNEKKQLIEFFEKKYSRFIQEGSWNSDDYVDDNLYYLDAESTLHNSSQPKINYKINVIEISQIEGYENYVFQVGDITHIQDPEFFGWIFKDGVKTPYREKIVVTETVTNFEEPEKDTITVQNYRSQFESLFHRITAATQKVEFYSGAYQRAANIITPEGSIVSTALEEAFSNNSSLLKNAKNQSVTWDESGITTINVMNPAEVVRITSGGIFLTNDGGNTWTTGITGNGINAKMITTGQLNTENVTILNGAQSSFRWDSTGINAYYKENEQYNNKTYVRFDQYGIYGIKEVENFYPESEEDIWNNANFALTWKGFLLKSGDDANFVSIDSENDFNVYIGNKELIRIGRLNNEGSQYGIRILNDSGKETFKATQEKLITGGWTVEPGGLYIESEKDGIFGAGLFSKELTEEYVINGVSTTNWCIIAGEKFGVTFDGTLYAKEANISGTINATSGTIGGLVIDELGELYIPADKVNGIIVKDSSDSSAKILFQAEVVANKVKIADWDVTTEGLRGKYTVDGVSTTSLITPQKVQIGTKTNTWENIILNTLNTPGLEVKDTNNNNLFFANRSDNVVKISEWIVQSDGLHSTEFLLNGEMVTSIITPYGIQVGGQSITWQEIINHIK